MGCLLLSLVVAAACCNTLAQLCLLGCRAEQEFRRLVLRYAPAGFITSLTKEVFKPHGDFDFEKRRSTNVRRSQDLRHNVRHPSLPLISKICCVYDIIEYNTGFLTSRAPFMAYMLVCCNSTHPQHVFTQADFVH